MQEWYKEDLGCGNGLSALEFAKAGYHVLGVDLSESLVAIAKKRKSCLTYERFRLFESMVA
jgi:2-polyprenyl-3-methyl-5-hydroxy-6-metoxy-1,4-benzoquinol methylase